MSLDSIVEDGRRLLLLGTNVAGVPTAVSLTANVAANTVGSNVYTNLHGMKYLIVEAVLTVTGGGGTADVYVQTSFDGGVTWIDIMNFHFTTSTLTKINAVKYNIALAANVTPTTGTLTNSTILDGVLGDSIRCVYTSGGTAYSAGSSLLVVGHAKG